MSIEIVLIPLAIAAFGAAKAKLEDGPKASDRREIKLDPKTHDRPQVIVRSRLRDGRLVASALTDLGISVRSASEIEIRGEHDDRMVTFARDGDNPWIARFDGAWKDDEALELVENLDAAYGLRVQEEVVQRIHDRAAAAGMTIESQATDEAHTVTLLLQVEDRV